MKLNSTIDLHCGQSGGSSLVPSDLPQQERDIVRKRLVRPFASPDVDAMSYKEDQQKDNAAFTGKPFRVQDTKYGHYISEHDTEEEANKASLARPYSRVLKYPEPSQTQEVRDYNRISAGGPGSGRRPWKLHRDDVWTKKEINSVPKKARHLFGIHDEIRDNPIREKLFTGDSLHDRRVYNFQDSKLDHAIAEFSKSLNMKNEIVNSMLGEAKQLSDNAKDLYNTGNLQKALEQQENSLQALHGMLKIMVGRE